MSQAKVDRYKEEKRNRAKIIKKEKREWLATKAGLSIIALVLVAWVGISAYNGITASDTSETEKPTYTVDTSAIDDFMSDLNAVD
jgi:negative regulator of sigma E activity